MSQTNSSKKNKEGAFPIKLKTMNSSVYQIVAYSSSSIASLQGQIEEKTGVPIGAQRLLFKGMKLEPLRTLSDYEINEGNTIQLVANRIPSQISSPSSYRQSQLVRLQKCNEQNAKLKKHRYLQQRINGFKFHKKQSIQTLNQTKHTIQQLLYCLNRNSEMLNNASPPFRTDKMKLEVGQWVDILDGSGQWLEGQVVNRNGNFLLIHYNNCPDSWNQWIAQTSQRIMPFRSQTVQSQQTQYLSPFPLNKCSISSGDNIKFQSSIESIVNSISSTLEGMSTLMKQFQLDEKQSEQSLKNISHISIQHDDAPKSDHNIEIHKQLKQEIYDTPSKEVVVEKQIPIDNLSNKCEDNISNKGNQDDGDISAKSFKSKRSQGLLNTSSMKSLIYDENKRKNNKIFFDYTQAQSVRSVKNKNKYQQHYFYNQENILEEEDSQYNDQEEQFYNKKKKQLQRKMRSSQLAPLCDRLGRFLVDLAPHLAMMGYTQQPTSTYINENLSTFTNEGSLQSKLANLHRMIPQEQQAKSRERQGYCNFQVPVMLTPAEIIRLNRLLEEESNHI